MMPDPVPHTIAAAFAWTRAALSGAEAEAEAVELFDRLLDLRRATLMAFPERILDATARARLLQAVQRRRAGEPLAYVLGWRGFWTLDLRVGPEVLIPRADTERLVELALQRMPPGVDLDVADLGTGSGAIALAVARERPRARLLACDASAGALRVARANARRLGVLNVTFVLGDWARALRPQSLDLLLSNPPYIESVDPHLHEGDLRFEPIGALASGPDGLDDLRRIVADAPRLLRPGGWILLEHGRAQGGAVRGLLQAAGFADVATEQDVEGRDRVSLGRMA